MRKTILIVTAAGLGKRIKEYSLKKYGQYVDKPLVELKNKKLLEWSIKPFYPLCGISESSVIWCSTGAPPVHLHQSARIATNRISQLSPIEDCPPRPSRT